MSTNDARVELLQGTLDLLILRTLLPGPAHGHAIAKSKQSVEFQSSDPAFAGEMTMTVHQDSSTRWGGTWLSAGEAPPGATWLTSLAVSNCAGGTRS